MTIQINTLKVLRVRLMVVDSRVREGKRMRLTLRRNRRDFTS